MIFEMTLDYRVVIPMTITVALSYGIRTLIQPQSIYTLKLARRGHPIPDALQANLLHLKRTGDIMDTQFVAVAADGKIVDFVRIALERPDVSCFPVEGPEGLVGFLTRDSALRPAAPKEDHVCLADLADKGFIIVDKDTPLLDVVKSMRIAGASVALVTDRSGNVTGSPLIGLITKHQIANAILEGMELFFD